MAHSTEEIEKRNKHGDQTKTRAKKYKRIPNNQPSKPKHIEFVPIMKEI